MTEEQRAAHQEVATPTLDATAAAAKRREDEIDWDSEESFPASDPPGWAGSGGVTREAPPSGPQAAWTVERRGDAEHGDADPAADREGDSE